MMLCMETFGERLRRLRLASGLSLNGFAREVGRDPGSISRIENGKRLVDRTPSYPELVHWAEVLAVSVEELGGESLSAGGSVGEPRAWYLVASDEDMMRRTGLVPAPPQAARAFEEIEYGMGARPIPQDIDDSIPRAQRSRRRPHVWMFRVTGTCLVPEINPGEIVYVNRDLGLAHGCYVAASLRGETAVVKRYVLRNGQPWLESNDGWEQIVDETVRIFGRVEGAQRSFL
jgi:transcriptional regulator with XRE-family HTH domain